MALSLVKGHKISVKTYLFYFLTQYSTDLSEIWYDVEKIQDTTCESELCYQAR